MSVSWDGQDEFQWSKVVGRSKERFLDSWLASLAVIMV
jgi:hypothetical protein